MSLLNLRALRGLRANVLECQRANPSFLRTSMPMNVSTCYRACQCFNLVCQHAKRYANFSTWYLNVPKGMPIFRKFFFRNVKGNFYTIVIHVICMQSYIKIVLYVISILMLYQRKVCGFFFFFAFSFLLFN